LGPPVSRIPSRNRRSGLNECDRAPGRTLALSHGGRRDGERFGEFHRGPSVFARRAIGESPKLAAEVRLVRIPGFERDLDEAGMRSICDRLEGTPKSFDRAHRCWSESDVRCEAALQRARRHAAALCEITNRGDLAQTVHSDRPTSDHGAQATRSSRAASTRRMRDGPDSRSIVARMRSRAGKPRGAASRRCDPSTYRVKGVRNTVPHRVRIARRGRATRRLARDTPVLELGPAIK
jgi:hypothetical protein